MLRWMYRERPSRIGGSVVWHRDAGAVGVVRVLPDGCIDVIARRVEIQPHAPIV